MGPHTLADPINGPLQAERDLIDHWVPSGRRALQLGGGLHRVRAWPGPEGPPGETPLQPGAGRERVPRAESVFRGSGLDTTDELPCSPTRASLPSRRSQMRKMKGRSGQSGSRKTRLEGERVGAEWPRWEGLRRGGESRGDAGQSGPGRTAKHPIPPLHRGRLPETSPPICS